MCMCVLLTYISVYAMYIFESVACDLPEWEMVISDHAGAGNQTLVPGRAASALNHAEGIVLLTLVDWSATESDEVVRCAVALISHRNSGEGKV